MSLMHKTLESIQESDLQALIDNRVEEGKSIEYKEQLPGGTDRQKKEFLADVSSFANAAGGDILFGVKAESGIPTGLCGVGDVDIDAEILRLEQSVWHGIEPTIAVRTLPVRTANPSPVIVLRMPRSWASPHMVKYGGTSRFYSRDSRGKHQLDVSEIRAAFLASETTAERVRDFRADRLAKIVAREGAVPLEDGPKVVLHLAPISAFGSAEKYNLHVLHGHPKMETIPGQAGWDRWNFDGYVRSNYIEAAGKCFAYVQAFHNGIIESADTYCLSSDLSQRDKGISSHYFERKVLGAVQTYLSLQAELGVSPPILVMLTLLGVKGYAMLAPYRGYYDRMDGEIDRDDLLVPESLVQSFEYDLGEVMRPILDQVWNAAGQQSSPIFNESLKEAQGKTRN